MNYDNRQQVVLKVGPDGKINPTFKDRPRMKYGNRRCTCLSRHVHDSRTEADYCNGLLADMQSGRITFYQIQVPYEVAPGITHVVDFLVQYPDPRISKSTAHTLFEVHEVKGVQTREWKIKYKLFVEKFPHIKYVIIDRRKPCRSLKKLIQKSCSRKLRKSVSSRTGL